MGEGEIESQAVPRCDTKTALENDTKAEVRRKGVRSLYTVTRGHQASSSLVTGVIHNYTVSSSLLSMNPFSLAATNASLKTVTVSPACSAAAESDGDPATDVTASFVARQGTLGAVVSFGR